VLVLVLLLAVTAVWGVTFVQVKDAVALYPLFAFLAVRFAIAGATLAPVAIGRLRGNVRAGTVLGLLLAAGYALQTAGLQRTTVSATGFVTGLYVRHRAAHAGLVLHVPLEVVDLGHDRVVDARVRLRLGDHLELVHAEREVRGDGARVLVEARVGPQLGHALGRVADLDVVVARRAERGQRKHDQHRDGRGPAPAQHRHLAEDVVAEPLAPGRRDLEALDVRDLQVRQHGRQQHLVDHDHADHAERRVEGHLADHVDVDQVDGREPDDVGDQRDDAGNEQRAERGLRGLVVGVSACGDRVGPGVDVLHGLPDRHRHDQERHQHRDGVEAQADQVQEAQPPD
jgi:hypothetical protein